MTILLISHQELLLIKSICEFEELCICRGGVGVSLLFFQGFLGYQDGLFSEDRQMNVLTDILSLQLLEEVHAPIN